MPNLFGVDIAGIMARNLGPKLLPATLRSITYPVTSTGIDTSPSNMNYVSYANHPARGFVSTFADYPKDSRVLVNENDRVVSLLGGGLGAVPKPGDIVIIENTSYTVVAILDRDPAGALYDLHCTI